MVLKDENSLFSNDLNLKNNPIINTAMTAYKNRALVFLDTRKTKNIKNDNRKRLYEISFSTIPLSMKYKMSNIELPNTPIKEKTSKMHIIHTKKNNDNMEYVMILFFT
jgi:hypothetical protein